MSVVQRALGSHRLFVEFPATGVAEWIAAAEVLIQEGHAAWALHTSQAGLLADALAIFGRRARVGVWGALTPADVERAVTAGAHFVTSPLGDAALTRAAGATPFLPGGLTPNELLTAAHGAEGAVQIVPAEAMSMTYVRSLGPLLGEVELVATGRLERFQVEMILATGVAAVGVSGVLLEAELPGADHAVNDLAEVRRRCQSYRFLSEVSPT